MGLLKPRNLILLAWLAIILLPKIRAAGECLRYAVNFFFTFIFQTEEKNIYEMVLEGMSRLFLIEIVQ